MGQVELFYHLSLLVNDVKSEPELKYERLTPIMCAGVRAVAKLSEVIFLVLKHGDRKGRHYYTTASQADSSVNRVVATLAVAMLSATCNSPGGGVKMPGQTAPYLIYFF